MNSNSIEPVLAREPRSRALCLLGSVLGPFLALGLVVLFFAVADQFQEDGGNFLTQRNFRSIAAQTAMVAVAALGMTVIIISGGIDLSAGTALALSATVLAWCLKHDYPVALALLCGIGAGCLSGLINGVLISALRVVPFIVTLGTMTFYLGTAKLLAEETTIRPHLATQVPHWLVDLLSTRSGALWFGLPTGVWLTLVLAGLLSLVLNFTVFGRYVYALGSNEATARLCGINVAWNKIALYSLAGAFVGVGGMYQFARLSTGNPTSGIGLELRIIAAVVIGGGSLNGGRGSVLGTLTGAAIMALIASGCTQLGLKNPVQDMILGVIIIAAVAVDQLRQRRLAT
jgi:ribose transport system permease protein